MVDGPFAGWEDEPLHPYLEGDDVHVWGWSLAGGVEDLARVQALLSADELQRMRSYRFAPDAERYARSRAGLRRILGRYLEVDAAEIGFVYGPYGKPSLREGHRGIEFNLSHTQGIAVVAFGVSGPLGIDVEERRPVSRALGGPVFSEREQDILQAISNEVYADAFFNGWTRKEAVCKAEGMGFHLPPQTFSVSILPGEQARILDAGGVLTRDWRLHNLSIGSRTAGALASDSAVRSIRLFRIPTS